MGLLRLVTMVTLLIWRDYVNQPAAHLRPRLPAFPDFMSRSQNRSLGCFNLEYASFPFAKLTVYEALNER